MLFVDDRNQEKEASFTIKIMPDVDAAVEAPICWTTFAVLRGITVDETAYFQLTSSDGLNIDIKGVKRTDEGNVSALVTGLKPDVTYSYKLASEQDLAMACEAVEFKVEAASVVPNLGFEDWNTDPGYNRPGGVNKEGREYWESGNKGAKMGSKILLQKTDDCKEGSAAAKLTSQWAGAFGLGAFSAGSVFSGSVIEAGTSGATLQYGQQYIGFPTLFKGWYKYLPGNIDYISNEKKAGGSDVGIIYIALTTETQIVKSPLKGTPVRFDPKASSVFAYGEKIITENVDTYTEFSIPLTYYQGKMPSPETPIYIIIMASSSKDGDVFTGSTSSVMYVDEFSLSYDYNQECLKETEYKDIPVNSVNNE